ncbi:MAG: hypothetical protein OHK0015_20610 [Chloroflexi bacterium OHK40]
MGTMALIEVRAAGRRYFVPQAHVAQLELLRASVPPSRTLLARALGPLLHPTADHGSGDRQALTVVLPDCTVALLVERVERLEESADLRPLAPLIARRLAAPWVLGVVVAGDEPVPVLDLRQIAADVARAAATQPCGV